MSNAHGWSDSEFSKWLTIDVGMSKACDGGDPTSYLHVLKAHERDQRAGVRFQLAYAALHNRTGAAAFVGIGVRLPITDWTAGQWVDATTTYTADTTDAQDRTGAGDFPLETTTNSDGFCVFANTPFSCLAIDVSTASVGAGVVRAARYSAAGAWKDLPNFTTTLPQTAGQNYAIQEHVALWVPPADWVVTTGAEGTGVPVGKYGFQVRATTAPTTAGLADSLTVHRLYWMTEGVADNAVAEVALGGMYAPLELAGEAMTAVIVNAAGTAPTMGSRITALARTRG